jgi:2-methylisocitrate lyase-like PEP mutase family enzyme
MAQPDVGLVSMPEFCKIIRETSLSSGLPVLADADTGFGEEEMVRAFPPARLTFPSAICTLKPWAPQVTKCVHEYWHAGAAGFHIEDQADTEHLPYIT